MELENNAGASGSGATPRSPQQRRVPRDGQRGEPVPRAASVDTGLPSGHRMHKPFRVRQEDPSSSDAAADVLAHPRRDSAATTDPSLTPAHGSRSNPFLLASRADAPCHSSTFSVTSFVIGIAVGAVVALTLVLAVNWYRADQRARRQRQHRLTPRSFHVNPHHIIVDPSSPPASQHPYAAMPDSPFSSAFSDESTRRPSLGTGGPLPPVFRDANGRFQVGGGSPLSRRGSAQSSALSVPSRAHQTSDLVRSNTGASSMPSTPSSAGTYRFPEPTQGRPAWRNEKDQPYPPRRAVPPPVAGPPPDPLPPAPDLPPYASPEDRRGVLASFAASMEGGA